MSVSGKNMSAVAQREQSPHVRIAPEDDVTATAAVAAVGSALGYILGSVEMTRAGTALTRAAKNLYIIYKI